LPADPASETTVLTRLAASSYVAPANSDIAAIKAKTDNLPADPASQTNVSSRLAAAAYTAPDNAGITAIKAKTDNLPADPASEGNVDDVKKNTDLIPALV
jgi:chorismate mutase